MSETDNDEAAEIAQLIHSICYDTYVRIPQAAVRLVERYVTQEAELLQKLRRLVQPQRAEVAAVQVACCLRTALPQNPGPDLDFDSYFTTTPEDFLAATEPAMPETEITDAAAVAVDDDVCVELEELLNSAT